MSNGKSSSSNGNGGGGGNDIELGLNKPNTTAVNPRTGSASSAATATGGGGVEDTTALDADLDRSVNALSAALEEREGLLGNGRSAQRVCGFLQNPWVWGVLFAIVLLCLSIRNYRMSYRGPAVDRDGRPLIPVGGSGIHSDGSIELDWSWSVPGQKRSLTEPRAYDFSGVAASEAEPTVQPQPSKTTPKKQPTPSTEPEPEPESQPATGGEGEPTESSEAATAGSGLDAAAVSWLAANLLPADVDTLSIALSANGVTTLEQIKLLKRDHLIQYKIPIGERNRLIRAVAKLNAPPLPAPPAPPEPPKPDPTKPVPDAVWRQQYLKDGLRHCTLPAQGSLKLACQLLNYRRNVQLPAMEYYAKQTKQEFKTLVPAWDVVDTFFDLAVKPGDAAECAKEAPIPLGRTPGGAPKWLIFHVLPGVGHNGGFADRMIGVMMGFATALMTNRAFGIEYTYPVPLASSLAQNVLPWADRAPPWIPESQQSLLRWVMNGGPDVLGTMNSVANAEVVVVRANMNFLSRISGGYAGQWASYGLPGGHNLDSLYSCFFSYLFAPTEPVRKLLMDANLPLSPSYPRPSQLTTVPRDKMSTLIAPYSPDPQEKSFTAGDKSTAPDGARGGAPHLLCAQLRMGGALAWQDTQTINAASTSLEPVWAAIDGYQSREKANVDWKDTLVFVTSDSRAVLSSAAKRFGAERLRTISGDIVHLDRSEFTAEQLTSDGTKSNSEEYLRTRAAFYPVIADNYALGLCEYVVVSNSGFGRTGVWRTRVPYANAQIFVHGSIQPLRSVPFNHGTQDTSVHGSLP